MMRWLVPWRAVGSGGSQLCSIIRPSWKRSDASPEDLRLCLERSSEQTEGLAGKGFFLAWGFCKGFVWLGALLQGFCAWSNNWCTLQRAWKRFGSSHGFSWAAEGANSSELRGVVLPVLLFSVFSGSGNTSWTVGSERYAIWMNKSLLHM